MTAKRLLILGDSILKGVMWNSDAGKYKLCESKDFDSLSAIGIEVVNKSKMGATTEKGLCTLEKNSTLSNPDSVVLIEYGGNDCDFDWSPISENPHGQFQPHITPEHFRENYRRIIERVKATGARVLISSLLPLNSASYFAWITRGLNKENILSWLGDVSMLSRWQEYYNTTLMDLAKSEGCSIIDIRSIFLQRHDFPSLLCADGIHPTQKGHDLIEATLRRSLTCITA